MSYISIITATFINPGPLPLLFYNLKHFLTRRHLTKTPVLIYSFSRCDVISLTPFIVSVIDVIRAGVTDSLHLYILSSHEPFSILLVLLCEFHQLGSFV